MNYKSVKLPNLIKKDDEVKVFYHQGGPKFVKIATEKGFADYIGKPVPHGWEVRRPTMFEQLILLCPTTAK